MYSSLPVNSSALGGGAMKKVFKGAEIDLAASIYLNKRFSESKPTRFLQFFHCAWSAYSFVSEWKPMHFTELVYKLLHNEDFDPFSEQAYEI